LNIIIIHAHNTVRITCRNSVTRCNDSKSPKIGFLGFFQVENKKGSPNFHWSP